MHFHFHRILAAIVAAAARAVLCVHVIAIDVVLDWRRRRWSQ
jgi:hypothetical protein